MENRVKYGWINWKIKPVYKEDKFVEVEFGNKTQIEDAIGCAIAIAKEIGAEVAFELNEVRVEVDQNSKPNTALCQYIFG